MKVTRDTARHEIDDLNVTSQLRGDFAAAHLAGDNAHVVATDTQKNTIFAFARDGIGIARGVPAAARRPLHELVRLGHRRPVGGRAVRVAAHPRRATPSTTTRSCAAGQEVRTARRRRRRRRAARHRRAQGAHGAEDHRVGVRGLPEGPVHDAARDPRPHPRHGCRRALALRDAPRSTTTPSTRACGRCSSRRSPRSTRAALQATLFDMGRRVLERHPEIAEIRFSMPNKHHFVVDLSPVRARQPERGVLRGRPALRPDRGGGAARGRREPGRGVGGHRGVLLTARPGRRIPAGRAAAIPDGPRRPHAHHHRRHAHHSEMQELPSRRPACHHRDTPPPAPERSCISDAPTAPLVLHPRPLGRSAAHDPAPALRRRCTADAMLVAMPDLLRELARLGHVARVATLHAEGSRRPPCAPRSRAGLVLRPRRGWIASPLADRDQLRAIAIGGRIGCASALRRFGVWSGVDDALHLQVPRTASRLAPAARSPVRRERRRVASVGAVSRGRRGRIVRLASDAAPRVHWAIETRAPRCPRLDRLAAVGARLRAPLHGRRARERGDRLRAARSGCSPDVRSTRSLASLPERSAALVDGFTGRPESGVESLFVRRIGRVPASMVESQVDLAGFGRYDGVINGCVLFEVDGHAFHSGSDRFFADRDRTLRRPGVRRSGGQAERSARDRGLADDPRGRGPNRRGRRDSCAAHRGLPPISRVSTGVGCRRRCDSLTCANAGRNADRREPAAARHAAARPELPAFVLGRAPDRTFGRTPRAIDAPGASR